MLDEGVQGVEVLVCTLDAKCQGYDIRATTELEVWVEKGIGERKQERKGSKRCQWETVAVGAELKWRCKILR